MLTERGMKSKKISNSKYKNTGVLFELMVRQITADTLAGKDSPALAVMTKYFNSKTELGKELQLYRAFFDAGTLSEGKSIHFIDLILEQRCQLDDRKLAREKYELIKEIKEIYPLKDFLSYKIPNYTIHASIYKTFATESAKDKEARIVNFRDVANARFTLIEHLSTGIKKRETQKRDDALLAEFRSQNEDLRMLTYKLAVDKFNEKYTNLNDKQKVLLREYINNVPTTNSLGQYIKAELPRMHAVFTTAANNQTNKVVQIKLQEVASQLEKIGKQKTIQDSEITAMMIAYEILKEISYEVEE
jgi:hypothetical protein